ncbi:amidase [Roseomonas sp. OT10]|uniref:amidase n=1 Tax=Roseomonas cutis TaxID=2897332 RepID=UPI001E37A85D|nr:amidase family protein [Roseomonas sp. OT10]UFN51013.1 amidase [Roseomonas sp. OT10]
MTDACDLTALEARRLIGTRKLSPVELVQSCLARIGEVDKAVNAMVALDTDRALAAARNAEREAKGGARLGPLHGLPLGIKDLEDTAGLVTTYGSPIFRDHVPDRDQGMVARLREAGGIVLGKTNTPEFGAGANTRNAVYGATGNPFDPTRSAAGSSGGSAVALACGMVPLASGSDTGGSLRNPAAFCGIVGFRPSPGIVPSGRRPIGWTPLPVLGPMARNVPDLCLMMSAMASDDAADPLAYTLHDRPARAVPADFFPVRRVDLSSLRVAATEDLGFAPTEGLVREAFRARVAALEPLFGELRQGHPDSSGADEAFAVLRADNFLAGLGDKVRANPQDYGPNVRANVAEGDGYSLADHARAAVTQTAIYRRWQAFFRDVDVMISPAITVSPRPWSELYPRVIDGQETHSYFHWLALAYGVTLVGHPAISLPMGVDSRGMPFGLQIIGPRGGDALVLAVAAAIEAEVKGDPTLARPVPDLGRLRQAPPISGMPGFIGFD